MKIDLLKTALLGAAFTLAVAFSQTASAQDARKDSTGRAKNHQVRQDKTDKKVNKAVKKEEKLEKREAKAEKKIEKAEKRDEKKAAKQEHRDKKDKKEFKKEKKIKDSTLAH